MADDLGQWVQLGMMMANSERQEKLARDKMKQD
jgi:hypothetical protein